MSYIDYIPFAAQNCGLTNTEDGADWTLTVAEMPHRNGVTLDFTTRHTFGGEVGMIHESTVQQRNLISRMKGRLLDEGVATCVGSYKSTVVDLDKVVVRYNLFMGDRQPELTDYAPPITQKVLETVCDEITASLGLTVADLVQVDYVDAFGINLTACLCIEFDYTQYDDLTDSENDERWMELSEKAFARAERHLSGAFKAAYNESRSTQARISEVDLIWCDTECWREQGEEGSVDYRLASLDIRLSWNTPRLGGCS